MWWQPLLHRDGKLGWMSAGYPHSLYDVTFFSHDMDRLWIGWVYTGLYVLRTACHSL